MALSEHDLDNPLSPLSEEALHWLVMLHGGEADEADWQRYEDWCLRSEAHQAAADEAELLWQRLGSALQRPRRRRTPALLLLLGLTFSVAFWQGNEQGWLADQRTGVAERRTLQLEDGSRLELAPETRVDLRFEDRQRVLTLYRGQLHVQVAADPQRPFVVEAADGAIRALGTGFDVWRDGDDVRLSVTEHRVRVRQGAQQRDVDVGQSLAYGARGMADVQPVDLESAGAWRRDRLVVEERPLGEVLSALSRYHSGVWLVRDAALRELPVTAVFDTRDAEAQLALLEASLPIRLRRLPWLTLIEARAQ
ncbi:FecR family protein [Pseudomonas sp. ABC1]|uniref:FecR family protein n=1 Tax=Pseudomonas sp. ABC1 TaxID=2748080 RepID=UPI002119FD9A|nr:FecR family protein [Pseudomonas sp. ABC1]